MGWGHNVNAAGRDIGYLVNAECDQPDCQEVIDRGLYFCCGSEAGGGEHGCGGYFCGAHLYFAGNETDSANGTLCRPCCDRWMAGHPDKEDEGDGPSE